VPGGVRLTPMAERGREIGAFQVQAARQPWNDLERRCWPRWLTQRLYDNRLTGMFWWIRFQSFLKQRT